MVARDGPYDQKHSTAFIDNGDLAAFDHAAGEALDNSR